jgi:hypothetical protein
MPDIENLHESLFGYIPTKTGTAYERIGALVLATLGWTDVVHDTRERPSGRQASHQIDIVAHDPAGEIRRLLVECKDWDKNVGQGTLNALVGVRAQTGADAAAVITTEGFSRGALKVAADEDISLVRLAAYDPARHGTNFATRITVTVNQFNLVHSEFRAEVIERPESPIDMTSVRIDTGAHLRHEDGSAAERIKDVLLAHASPRQEGVFHQRADLASGRFLPTENGAVEIRALTWTETNHLATYDIVHEAKGEPVLLLEEVDHATGHHPGRLVVSEDLFAWDIDDQGNVVARGSVGPT